MIMASLDSARQHYPGCLERRAHRSPPRHRDAELVREGGDTRQTIVARWERGWAAWRTSVYALAADVDYCSGKGPRCLPREIVPRALDDPVRIPARELPRISTSIRASRQPQCIPSDTVARCRDEDQRKRPEHQRRYRCDRGHQYCDRIRAYPHQRTGALGRRSTRPRCAAPPAPGGRAGKDRSAATRPAPPSGTG